MKTHCKNGHPYDEANTYVRKNGRYMCRACHRERELARTRTMGVLPRGLPGSGWTCGHDPATDMRATTPDCAVCQREGSAARYRADPEKYQAAGRAHYHENREVIKARVAAWAAANPEKVRATAAAWQRANRARINATKRAWEAAGGRHIPPLSPDERRLTGDWAQIIAKDPCAYCGEPFEHIDHIVPISKGGDGMWDNLTAACATCNRSKGPKSLLMFLYDRVSA